MAVRVVIKKKSGHPAISTMKPDVGDIQIRPITAMEDSKENWVAL